MTADLALLAADPSSVERYGDPAEFVMLACERAKQWLTQATDHDHIEQIVEVKSQAEAIRVYTAQKQLGKDAELAAAEVVRRAERGIGLAIRKGQEAGAIESLAEARSRAGRTSVRDQIGVTDLIPTKPRPTDFATPDELSGNGAGIYQLTDGVSEEDFESAIDEAKAERNLTRANVVRKAKAKAGKVSASQQVDKIREMAARGNGGPQIAKALGASEEWVRRIARDNGVEITADRVVGKVRKHDSNHIVSELVTALEGLAMGAQMVDANDLDRGQIWHWTASLTESIRSLNRLNKTMKEAVQ